MQSVMRHFLGGETMNGLQGIAVSVLSESSFLSLGKHCDSVCGFLKEEVISSVFSLDSSNTTKINQKMIAVRFTAKLS